MILDICDSPNVLEVMLIIKKVITIIKVAVPIILIVSLMVGFAKAIRNDDSDALAKAKKAAVAKVIAAVLVFLIPTFVDLITKTVAPESDYSKCLGDISQKTIYDAYNNQMEKLLKTAEESEKYSDYSAAETYLLNIKDPDKQEEYRKRLEEVKETIEKNRADNNKPQYTGGKYSKVNYDNFKWTYYKAKSGPLKDYEKECNPYAIYAPSDVNDLNGVSLPLIIWLHGAGESKVDKSSFLNSGLLKVVKEWKNYNLEPIPAIIVAPQATPGWWGGYKSNHNTIYALLNYAKEKYNIDPSRVVLIGHSMGAHGVLELSLEMPKLNLYAAVTMSTKREEYGGNKGKEFYSSIKMKGYGEIASHQKFYDWIGQSKNYTYYKNASHGSVPQKALTEDLNKDGVSDLMYWLFENDASTKPKETNDNTNTDNNNSNNNNNNDTPTNDKPTPYPITSYVNVSTVNNMIASTAKSRGLYSRQAVVSVATTLVNTLSSSNYHIPYQLGGMYHRGTAWGLNPNWGTVITHNNKYVLSGLDCRNFVNWTFKQAGLSLIRGYGYEGSINNKYGDTYSNFSDGRPGDVIDANEHIMLIVSNNKSSSSYTVAESVGGYGVHLKTYTYDFLQNQSIKYRVYNMDGVYNNTGLYCPENSGYRAYSGSCHIPKSQFPSYYGF